MVDLNASQGTEGCVILYEVVEVSVLCMCVFVCVQKFELAGWLLHFALQQDCKYLRNGYYL